MCTTKFGRHTPAKCSLLFTFVVYNSIAALGQIKVSGKVVNSTGYPMSYAVVELCKDTTVVQAVLTDSVGVYQMQVKQGKYYQNCRYAGSLQKGQAVTIVRDTIINIEFVKQIALEEVVVSSKKPLIERKIDRYIFNVENSIVSTGSDAWEALSKTPGVRIQNNQLSLVGKSNVSVMIDDRLVQLSDEALSHFLKSIPSDNIQKIEVITNPPAQYDAQGSSGLINIVRKKNLTNGYSGSANLGYTQATYPIYSGGADITYNSTKVVVYAGGSLTNGHTRPIQRNSMFYPEQTWEQTITQKIDNKVFNGRTGIDFNLSKNAKFGLAYAANFGYPNFPDKIETILYNNIRQVDSTLTTSSFTNWSNASHDMNAHAEIYLNSPNKKITIDGNWFTFEDHRDRDFVNERYYSSGKLIPKSFTNNRSVNNQTIDIYSLKADANLPFKKFTLSTGGKLNMTYNNSDVSLFQVGNKEQKSEAANSSLFKYQEMIQAVYFRAHKEYKSWAFQIGMRGENTQAKGISVTDGATQTYNYNKLFPTLFVSYTANKKNTFTANYGRRINRPSYNTLNPFRWYLNPYAYTEGNPFLQPSYNHNVEFSHTYAGKLTTALSYTLQTDAFSQITLVENNSRFQVTKPFNFFTYQSYQLTNSFSFFPAKWLETGLQSSLIFSLSQSNLQQVTREKLKAWSEYVSIDNQVLFNKAKTIVGSLSIWYQSPTVKGPFKIRSIWNMDIGVKVLFLKKRLQLSLIGSDVFRSTITRAYNNVNNILQYYHNYNDTRRVKFIVTFNFGNNKFARKERLMGNEEEKKKG